MSRFRAFLAGFGGKPQAPPERPAEDPEALMEEIVDLHNYLYHEARNCSDDDHWECAARRDEEEDR